MLQFKNYVNSYNKITGKKQTTQKQHLFIITAYRFTRKMQLYTQTVKCHLINRFTNFQLARHCWISEKQKYKKNLLFSTSHDKQFQRKKARMNISFIFR